MDRIQYHMKYPNGKSATFDVYVNANDSAAVAVHLSRLPHVNYGVVFDADGTAVNTFVASLNSGD